jgi:hypothetical protein
MAGSAAVARSVTAKAGRKRPLVRNSGGHQGRIDEYINEGVKKRGRGGNGSDDDGGEVLGCFLLDRAFIGASTLSTTPKPLELRILLNKKHPRFPVFEVRLWRSCVCAPFSRHSHESHESGWRRRDH